MTTKIVCAKCGHEGLLDARLEFSRPIEPGQTVDITIGPVERPTSLTGLDIASDCASDLLVVEILCAGRAWVRYPVSALWFTDTARAIGFGLDPKRNPVLSDLPTLWPGVTMTLRLRNIHHVTTRAKGAFLAVIGELVQ